MCLNGNENEVITKEVSQEHWEHKGSFVIQFELIDKHIASVIKEHVVFKKIGDLTYRVKGGLLYFNDGWLVCMYKRLKLVEGTFIKETKMFDNIPIEAIRSIADSRGHILFVNKHLLNRVHI